MTTCCKNFEPQQILVGICGGVAAYKSVEIVSALRKAGHEVTAVLTDAAAEFVRPRTFAAVAGRPAISTLFPSHPGSSLPDQYPHLYPATEADICVIAPATADMIAQIAAGLGKDVLSTSVLSLPASCQRFFCPSMNVEMWNNPVVQRNIKTIEALGWQRIGPESGHLACGTTGAGRMSEPGCILAAIEKEPPAPLPDLAGKRALIFSGPTHEHLDPIRFIGNPSSGKMGRALAEAAQAAGLQVDLVSGPVHESNLPAASDQLHIHRVTSADEMLQRGHKLFSEADLVIYVAAVADYRPIEYHDEKLPKKEGNLSIEMEATPDIAATLNQLKKPDQVAIGFALQTDNGPAAARGKLARKNFDGIVLNYPDSLGGDTGSYQFLAAGDDDFDGWGALSKDDCAQHILRAAAQALSAQRKV